jgi:transcriptional regulator with XRE-family HTH domain
MGSKEMTDQTNSPARRVRIARLWADLSRADLAAGIYAELSIRGAGASRYSESSIREIERGKREVTTEELLAVATVCRVPDAFLLSGWGEEGEDHGLVEHLERSAEMAREVLARVEQVISRA